MRAPARTLDAHPQSVFPAKAGIQVIFAKALSSSILRSDAALWTKQKSWVPAFAGKTDLGDGQRQGTVRIEALRPSDHLFMLDEPTAIDVRHGFECHAARFLFAWDPICKCLFHDPAPILKCRTKFSLFDRNFHRTPTRASIPPMWEMRAGSPRSAPISVRGCGRNRIQSASPSPHTRMVIKNWPGSVAAISIDIGIWLFPA